MMYSGYNILLNMLYLKQETCEKYTECLMMCFHIFANTLLRLTLLMAIEKIL